jgi:peroxiredoxin
MFVRRFTFADIINSTGRSPIMGFVGKLVRIVFVLPDYLRDLYKSFGSALDRFHDESEYRLPIPARYVIDKDGIIRAADVNADYTIRPEPSETVRVLRTLTA